MKDQDLDEIDKGLRTAGAPSPYIAKPDTQTVRSGSLCWIDGTRVCGPDCMGFNPEEIDEGGVEIDTPNRCLPLYYLGQLGSAALTTIAANRQKAKQSQDRVREQNGGKPPVPEVR